MPPLKDVCRIGARLLHFLFPLSWIAENFPESVRFEPRPSDGLNQLAVAEEGCGLLAEVQEGAWVGEAFFMFMTADKSIAFEQDKAVLRLVL
jgi:hypothetical protein